MRISKVTTKKGDKGNTSLGDGKIVSKTHPSIDVLGDLDELNAMIGFAITACDETAIKKELLIIQNDLFSIGGEISLPDKEIELLSKDRITTLESQIEEMNKTLPALKEFILPGGNEFTSRLHITRAVCRRVERQVVSLLDSENGNTRRIQYLNRLSDYLFVLARYCTQSSETQWKRS